MIQADEAHLWFCGAEFSLEILAAYLQVDPSSMRFARGCYGKPQLEPFDAAALSFNRSNAGGRHLLALSSYLDGNANGVDLLDSATLSQSECRDLLDDYFPQVHVPLEGARLAFARLWTQCEALAKASGLGLHDAKIPAACCALYAKEEAWRNVLFEGAEYSLTDLNLGAGFHAALALPGYGTRRVRIFRAASAREAMALIARMAMAEVPAAAR